MILKVFAPPLNLKIKEIKLKIGIVENPPASKTLEVEFLET